MPTARQTSTAREGFVNHLRVNGRRVTAERLMIFDAVAADSSLFTADTLYARLHTQGCNVSLATVYNTLQVMVEASIIRRIRTSNSAEACYQLSIAAPSGAYCQCDSCGSLRQVAPKDLMRYIGNYEFATFAQHGFTLVFHGTCRKCSRRKVNNKAESNNQPKLSNPNNKNTKHKK